MRVRLVCLVAIGFALAMCSCRAARPPKPSPPPPGPPCTGRIYCCEKNGDGWCWKGIEQPVTSGRGCRCSGFTSTTQCEPCPGYLKSVEKQQNYVEKLRGYCKLIPLRKRKANLIYWILPDGKVHEVYKCKPGENVFLAEEAVPCGMTYFNSPGNIGGGTIVDCR